jgi:prevent-host-death family protein
MSSPIGAFDAKTHLSEYLERVAGGERFVITKRGRPVAELRGVGSDRLAALEACQGVRERVTGEVDVAALVREDRER